MDALQYGGRPTDRGDVRLMAVRVSLATSIVPNMPLLAFGRMTIVQQNPAC